ncbi:unnamed protein product, partial [Discosporangium mesarthrocarpum]
MQKASGADGMLLEVSSRLRRLQDFILQNHFRELSVYLSHSDLYPSQETKILLIRKAVRHQVEIGLILPVRRYLFHELGVRLKEPARHLQGNMKKLQSDPSTLLGEETPRVISAKGWGPAKQAMMKALWAVLPSDQVDALRGAAERVVELHASLQRSTRPKSNKNSARRAGGARTGNSEGSDGRAGCAASASKGSEGSGGSCGTFGRDEHQRPSEPALVPVLATVGDFSGALHQPPQRSQPCSPPSQEHLHARSSAVAAADPLLPGVGGSLRQHYSREKSPDVPAHIRPSQEMEASCSATSPRAPGEALAPGLVLESASGTTRFPACGPRRGEVSSPREFVAQSEAEA